MGPWGSIHFQSIFYLFRLDNFCCSVFQFTGFFISPIHFTVESRISCSFCFFGSCIFIWLLLILSIYWDFLWFSFVSNVFVFAHWTSVTMASLNSLTDCSGILGLVSVGCLFFLQFESLLVLCVMSDFQQKLRHFCIVLGDSGYHLFYFSWFSPNSALAGHYLAVRLVTVGWR